MSNAIRDARFFTAGHAIFTVANPQGEHYTFKISRPDETTPFFASLLTSPDRYTYIGIYAEKQPLRLTKKSHLPASSKPVQVFNWAVAMVASGKELPAGYSIQHEGCCCRCGRTLTTPESIDTGVGPECARIMGINWARAEAIPQNAEPLF